MQPIAAKKITQPKPGSKLEALRVMRADKSKRPATAPKVAAVPTQAASAAATPAISATSSETPMRTNLKTATKKNTKATSTARRKRSAKTAKSTAPKAPKAPRGFVVDILRLSCRPSGVSRDELNDLTKWKGAPWKWLFKNPKKTGYCDRWGYTLKITEGKDGEVRYHTTKS